MVSKDRLWQQMDTSQKLFFVGQLLSAAGMLCCALGRTWELGYNGSLSIPPAKNREIGEDTVSKYFDI